MQLAPEWIPFEQRRALRMAEATQYSGLGRTTIYTAIDAGKIETTKIGKRRLVFRESLDRFLAPKTTP
jgi:excisionase family DNA binding protein